MPWLALLLLAAVLACAAAGDWIAPFDPNDMDLGASFQPPVWQAAGGWDHLLGTDNLGHDILSRIVAGSRVSVVVAFYAIVLSGAIGALAGHGQRLSSAAGWTRRSCGWWRSSCPSPPSPWR